jgi:glycosyltransferase involved in cell wall biosynthesis
MKIAIYTGTYKKYQDGVAKTLYELVRGLGDSGIEVGVWSPLVTPSGNRKVSVHKMGSLPFPLYRDYRMVLPSRRTFRELEDFKPDVIHISTPDIGGVSFLRYALKRKIGVLAVYHTDFPSYLKYYHLSFLESLMWKYLGFFYNRCHVVCAPTNVVATALKHSGLRKIKIWPRGIRRDMYHPKFRSQELRKAWGASGKKTIFFSGRFAWYKGLEIFVKVYEFFHQRNPGDVKFVLLGDGPIKRELQGRMPDAEFVGYLTGEDLSKAYASGDILLFPSVTETFGNVILEALSSGSPAVVSDRGGGQEIIRKSGGGLTARAGKAEHFYQCCKALVEDQRLYDAFRKKGLEFAEKQSWAHINKRIIEEYVKLSNKSNR